MQFETPTTKAEMYATLKEIYTAYRLQSPVYKEETLIDMTIPTLTVPNKTQAECDAEATLNLSAEHTREIERVKSELEDKILALDLAAEKFNQEKVEKINNIQLEYEKKLEAVNNQSLEKGVSVSSIFIAERNKIAKEQAEKIVEQEKYYDFRASQLQAEKEVLTTRLSSVEEYFSPIHQKEIDALSAKLYKEYQEKKLDVEKHNNSVYEKNVKYKNVIIQNRASFELKFMEVRREYTTSELIDMGYYEDVLRCVFGYYDTLSVDDAYEDVIYEQDLMYYLDTYYEGVIKLLYQRTLS